VTYIARHEIDQAFLEASRVLQEERFAADIQEYFLQMQQTDADVAGALNKLYLACLDRARLLCVLDPHARETMFALDVGCCAMATAIRLANGSRDEFRPGEKYRSVVFKPTGPTRYSHARHWLECHHLALLCDRDEIFPDLMRHQQVVAAGREFACPEYMRLTIDALAGIYQQRPFMIQRVKRASAAVQALSEQAGFCAGVLRVRAAELEALAALIRRDADAFDLALAQALLAHRAYWEHETRKNDPRGWWNLFCAAMARIAHATNLPLQVDSDYMIVEVRSRPLTLQKS
jgi:hypothetical protein